MEIATGFIEFLRACITPVALISGVGLLLLTITNRLGRTIDRTRQLTDDLNTGNASKHEEKLNEVKILYQRSRYLRISIGAMVLSVIAGSMIIPVLFFMVLLDIDLRILGFPLFAVSIFCILISLIYFFLDIRLALHALRLEADEYLGG